MIVRVNCPIAGCGIQVQVQSLSKHLEKVHELDGELVLRLHPTATYEHTPADDQEPEGEAEPEKEPADDQEPEGEAEPKKEPEQEQEPEKEPEPETEPGTEPEE